MRKINKKLLSVLTITCMCTNLLPFGSLITYAQTTTAHSKASTTDELSGWQKVSGNGSLAIKNEGFGNYLNLNSDDNTIFADTKAESRTDGYVEMNINNIKNARFGIIFRYNNPTDWQGIGVDSGNWTWFKGDGSWGSVNSTKQSFATTGENHKIKVEYRGTTIRVLEDGKEIINQVISEFANPKTGKIGMRLWGVKADGYDCQLNLTQIKTGQLAKEITLTPSNIALDYDEVGKNDVQINLNDTTPKLVAIKNGQESLTANVDYDLKNATVTLKKSYLAKIKDIANTDLTFEFSDGQKKTCSIMINKPDKEVSYQRDFSQGITGFEKVTGNGNLVWNENNKVAQMQGDGLFIDQQSETLKNQEVEFLYDPMNNNCNYGVVLRYNSPNDYLYVGPASQYGQHYTNWGVYTPKGKVADIQDSGFILSGRVKPYKIKVRVIDDVITIFVDNEEIYTGQVNGITQNPGKVGFYCSNSTGMNVYQFKQQTAKAPQVVTEDITETTIKSNQMTVKLDKDFPRVISYDLDGQTINGQELALHQLEVNNTLYKPEVKSEVNPSSITYHVKINELAMSFDVIFEVKDNILTLKIANVIDDHEKLYTLNFPGQSLVSMSSQEPNASLKVNNYQNETTLQLAQATAQKTYNETTLAVLSNDNVAAAIGEQSYKNRHEIAYQTFNVGDHTSTGLWMNEYAYRGLDGKKLGDNMWTKVSITKDRNQDNKVDYQDGAIALRDDCLPRKTGADIATSNWSMIAMNVGSEAQYPFLRILDNAKKMSLATDNFGQNIIIKGYQGEGHDSSHPDFANYNKHAGGLEDFKTLLDNAEKWNAKIGIHINQTDVYPESPEYKKIKTDLGAWSWYDTAQQIVRENDDLDTSSNGLDARFSQLYDKDTANKIATTYIDVFFGTRWPMYKLVDNINRRGMALGTEYVDEMVSYSVFAHHIGSNFGGAGNLVRFVDNNQADIFANDQLFHGEADRASDDVGIDGWQNAKNFYNAIQAFYEKVLPNKYLAQYPVMQYTANQAVLGKNNQVVTKIENNVNVITQDGKKVLEGNKVFIPWDNESKIYHWNREGGTTTWQLPNSWKNVKTVTLYNLDEKGKTNAKTLTVTNGEVTIDAKAKQGYVLYKDKLAKAEIKTAANVDWSQGSPIKDMGFDSYTFKNWQPSSSSGDVSHIQIKNNNLGNAHLYITGTKDGQVSQTMTNLVPGQAYSASVWAITDDGRKASISVENGDQTVTNYMTRSNVIYGIHHNDKYKTYAQRMKVTFVAKATTAKLVLSVANGKDENSQVDFDDVRVAKVTLSQNPQPTKYLYWEDFENIDQGFGPFVSTESDQSHLSQRNPINPEYTTDVIAGDYSLKIRAGDYLRTLPSTVRLEPNTEYTVGIDYKSPTANAFTLAVKSDKAKEANDTEHAVIASTDATLQNQNGHLELKFTTGNYDDYYIDVTKKSGSEYYLDNFYVEAKKPINHETLGELIAQADALQPQDYTEKSYTAMLTAKKAAQEVYDNSNATNEQIKAVYEKLEKALENLDKYATSQEKQELQTLVEQLKTLQITDYKQDSNWLTFQSILTQADKLLAKSKVTVKEIQQMTSNLNQAKDKLVPLVDRTQLHKAIKKAQLVDRNAIVDGKELQSFLSALNDAQAIDLKAGVTESEIANATQTLTNAYQALILKPESQAELIATAIAQTNVKEEYFLDEDWQVIQTSKQKLQALQSQTNVSAAAFYDILEQLNASLANKLSRPKISDAVKIAADNFVVSANTQQAQTGNEGPIKLAFDNNPNTIWHSAYAGFAVSESNPAIVEINLGKIYKLNQFSYLQRPQGGDNGKLEKYNLYVKEAKDDAWTKVVDQGTFKDVNEVQKVKFAATKAQYVKLEILSAKNQFASAAEFAVYEQASDFSKLQAEMNQFDKLDASQYTTNSYQKVQAIMKEAEKLLETPTIQQSKIDQVAEKLAQGLNDLKLLATSIDIQTLTDAVTAAKQVDLDKYQDTTKFSETLAKAQELLDQVEQTEVTQTEVLNLAYQLSKIQANLVPKKEVDKSKLTTLIKQISQLNEQDYTSDSWQKLQQVVAQAKHLLYLNSATQTQIDQIVVQLQTAIKQLQKKVVVDDSSNDNQTVETGVVRTDTPKTTAKNTPAVSKKVVTAGEKITASDIATQNQSETKSTDEQKSSQKATKNKVTKSATKAKTKAQKATSNYGIAIGLGITILVALGGIIIYKRH